MTKYNESTSFIGRRNTVTGAETDKLIYVLTRNEHENVRTLPFGKAHYCSKYFKA